MYLEDMHQAMVRIEAYITGHNYESFKQDTKTADAVIRNFEVIGEASKNIPKRIQKKYSSIPWLEMYYLRNKITHEYFGIDYAILWDIAKNHLPENKLQIVDILEKEFQQ